MMAIPSSSRAAGRASVQVRAVVAAMWLLTAAGGLAIVGSAIVGIDPAARDAAAAVTMFALIAADALTCTTVGALIVMRRPENLVGWLLAAVGVGLALTFAGFGSAGVRTEQVGPDVLGGLFLWTGVVAFNPTMALIGLVTLLFPDGQLPSPRLRAPIGGVIVMILLATVIIAIKPGVFDPTLPPNPFGVNHPVVAGLATPALAGASLGALGLILLGAVAVGYRFLRARGDTRQQLKWFLGAVADRGHHHRAGHRGELDVVVGDSRRAERNSGSSTSSGRRDLPSCRSRSAWPSSDTASMTSIA